MAYHGLGHCYRCLHLPGVRGEESLSERVALVRANDGGDGEDGGRCELDFLGVGDGRGEFTVIGRRGRRRFHDRSGGGRCGRDSSSGEGHRGRDGSSGNGHRGRDGSSGNGHLWRIRPAPQHRVFLDGGPLVLHQLALPEEHVLDVVGEGLDHGTNRCRGFGREDVEANQRPHAVGVVVVNDPGWTLHAVEDVHGAIQAGRVGGDQVPNLLSISLEPIAGGKTP